MKTESIVTIKKELKHLPKEELLELCIRLGKFKKENKAMLSYLLFQADDEDGYIENVKSTIDELFEEMKDRKSTRLNSSHVRTSYAVFCSTKKTAASPVVPFAALIPRRT